MERPLALVVDKDPVARAMIRDVFEEREVVALGAGSGSEAREALRSRPVSVVVLDCETPGVDAFEWLSYGMQLRPAPILIATLSASDPRATELVKAGALDVLRKPFDEAQLQQVVQRTLRHQALLSEIRQLREDLQSREGYHGLVGRSAAMERLREQIQRLASSDRPVWLVGEVGTGKELAARTLHARGGDPDRPFSVVSCAGLTPAAWEARFGGAGPRQEEGALYLEDLPALELDLQARLFKILGLADGNTVGRLDGGARVYCSSNVQPDKASEQGRLLDELQRGLASETLTLPALRERIEDIPLLARYFITTICAINHLPPIEIAPETVALLEQHGWPENVQELRNAMEQAVILSPDGRIRPRDLPDRIRDAVPIARGSLAESPSPARKFREAKRDVVEAFERSYLGGLMGQFEGNVTAASQQAGMLRSALQRLLRKYGLKSAEFRKRRPDKGGADASAPRR